MNRRFTLVFTIGDHVSLERFVDWLQRECVREAYPGGEVKIVGATGDALHTGRWISNREVTRGNV